MLYEPLDLIAKLAALIPRPHKNLVLYHGVLSANAALRSRVVAYGRDLGPSPDNAAPSPACDPAHRAARRQWTELMRRAFGHDLLACPSCGGKMVLIACILERSVIKTILAHLGLNTEPPSNARASPDPEPLFDDVA